MTEALFPDESYKIVGSLFDVYNELGYGYQENTITEQSKTVLLIKIQS